MSTIFAKIIAGEVPADIVFQDDRVTAFKDINPSAPVHILIVPNKEIPTVNDVTAEDEATLGHMFVVARQIAEEQGIAADGYRLIVNCRDHGGGGASDGPLLAPRRPRLAAADHSAMSRLPAPV